MKKTLIIKATNYFPGTVYVKDLREGLNGDWYFDNAYIPEDADRYPYHQYDNLESPFNKHMAILQEKYPKAKFEVLVMEMQVYPYEEGTLIAFNREYDIVRKIILKNIRIQHEIGQVLVKPDVMKQLDEYFRRRLNEEKETKINTATDHLGKEADDSSQG